MSTYERPRLGTRFDGFCVNCGREGELQTNDPNTCPRCGARFTVRDAIGGDAR